MLPDRKVLRAINKAIFDRDTNRLSTILRRHRDICTYDDYFPLHNLAYIGSVRGTDDERQIRIAIQFAKLFLDHGIDIDKREAHGNTALCDALFYGKTELAELFIDRNISLSGENGEGNIPSKYNPLIMALDFDNAKIANLLITRGANVRATSPVSVKNQMPYRTYPFGELKNGVLYYALMLRCNDNAIFDICEKLLRHGADPNQICYLPNADGKTFTMTRVLFLIYKKASERDFTIDDVKLGSLFAHYGAKSSYEDCERFGFERFPPRRERPVVIDLT